MKKMITPLVALLLGLSLSTYSAFTAACRGESKENSLFQVATIDSLAQGVYDGDYVYGKLMTQGDFGIGTFLDLNGEMVAVDGHFYQIDSRGKLTPVTPKQITPFAEVIFFKPTQHKTLGNISNYQELNQQLSTAFPNPNIPYAIRIDGTFKALKVRSLRQQKKPYPPLIQASKEQAIFNFQQIKGSLIGFWFPKYWGDVAVSGFHFHFVSADHRAGGHVLEVNLDHGQLSMAPIDQVQVYLPHTKEFAQANLSEQGLSSSIKKVEGGGS